MFQRVATNRDADTYGILRLKRVQNLSRLFYSMFSHWGGRDRQIYEVSGAEFPSLRFYYSPPRLAFRNTISRIGILSHFHAIFTVYLPANFY